MPEISVITAVYNAEKYLARAVRSVQNQTFTDWELLLVDDGATDTSGSMCDMFANEDARIRVFHVKNGGVSSARNKGIAEATGNYIAFMDNDDYVLPNWLQCMREAALETNADVIKCGALRIADKMLGEAPKTEKEISAVEQRIVPHAEVLTSQAFMRHLAFDVGYGAVWNQLCRKEIQKECLFPLGRLSEDLHVNIQIAELAKKIVCIPNALYCWMQHPGTQSKTSDRYHLDIMDDVNILLQKFVEAGQMEDANRCFAQKMALFFYGPLSAREITQKGITPTVKMKWQALQNEAKTYDFESYLPPIVQKQYQIFCKSELLYSGIMRVKYILRKK